VLKEFTEAFFLGFSSALVLFSQRQRELHAVHTGAIRVVGKSQFPPCASRVQGEEQSSPRRLGVCFGFKGKRIKAYTLHSTLFYKAVNYEVQGKSILGDKEKTVEL